MMRGSKFQRIKLAERAVSARAAFGTCGVRIPTSRKNSETWGTHIVCCSIRFQAKPFRVNGNSLTRFPVAA